MAVCAVVRIIDGVVVNRIMAEASDPAPDGCMLVDVGTTTPCGIGWTYADGVFSPPPEVIPDGD